MTTKEEILALAGECGIQNDYISEDQAVEAFYHAARKPLEEQYASMTKSFFDAQAQLREALALESKWRVEATGLRQQLAEAQLQIQQYREALGDFLVVASNEEVQKERERRNLRRAADLIVQPTDTSALDAIVTKAGEVMLERCAMQFAVFKWRDTAKELISALPGVTLADLKGAE